MESSKVIKKLVNISNILNKFFIFSVEGIEILCLIDLIIDACRYLQDNNEWVLI